MLFMRVRKEDWALDALWSYMSGEGVIGGGSGSFILLEGMGLLGLLSRSRSL